MCSFYSHKADLKMRWQGLFSGEHFPDPMKIPKHLLEALWYMCHLLGEAELQCHLFPVPFCPMQESSAWESS